MSIVVRLTGGQAAAIISTVATLLAFFVAKVLSFILPIYASRTLLVKGLVELTPLTESPRRILVRLTKGTARNKSFLFGILVIQTLVFLPGLLLPDLIPLGLEQVNCDSIEYTKSITSEVRLSNGTIVGPSGYLIGKVSQAIIRSKAAGVEHPVHPSVYSDHPDFVVQDSPEENSFTCKFLRSRRIYKGQYEAALNSSASRTFSTSSLKLLNVDDGFPLPDAQENLYRRARSFDDINRIVTFPLLQISNAVEESRDTLLISRFDTDEPVQLVEGLGRTFRGQVEIQELVVQREDELSVLEGTIGEAVELFGGLDNEDFATACNMASTAYVLAAHAGSQVTEKRDVLVYQPCQDVTTVVWSLLGVVCTILLVGSLLILLHNRTVGKVPLMGEAGNASLPIKILRSRDKSWAEKSHLGMENVDACLVKGDGDREELLTIYEEGMDVLSRKNRALIDDVDFNTVECHCAKG